MLALKTSDEIRLENLQKWVEDAGGLSKFVSLAPRKLSRATLDQILKRRQTANGTTKNVGDELARKIEQALKLPRGAMDHAATAPSTQMVGSAELISAESLVELIQLFGDATAIGKLSIIETARNAPKRLLPIEQS